MEWTALCYATAGIVSNVTLNGEALRGWRHTPIDVERACGSAAAATLPASNSLHTNGAPASGQLLPAHTTADEHSFLLRFKPAAPSPPRAEWPPTSSSFTPTFYSGNYTLTGVTILFVFSLLENLEASHTVIDWLRFIIMINR